MIRRLIALFVSIVACSLVAPPLQAGPDDAGGSAAHTSQQYGLERAWFTQLSGVPAPDAARNLTLFVSRTRSQTVFRITDQRGLTYCISERHLDTFGQPMGVEGAEKAAAEKIRLFKLEGIEATVEKQVIPDVTLYATSRGVVHAIDAETGRILWTTPLGRADHPTTAATVNDQWVAVVNGQQLYLLRAEDGNLVEQRRLHGGVPAAGPAIAANAVCVPMLTGQLFAYLLGPKDPKWPLVYRAHGLVEFSPTAIGDRVLWPTSKGVITAIDPGKSGVLYRLQLEDAIAGPLVYSPPSQLLVVTDNGYLYSFDIKTGSVKWRFSTGDQTAQPAAVVGDTVYLMSRDAGVYAVSSETGEAKWSASTARQFIAATKDKVYASTDTGILMVLDINAGNVISQIPMSPTDRMFANNQTDRIYIESRSGLIQCLRERGAERPTIHVTGGEMAAAEAAEAKPEDKASPGPEAQPADPFAKEPADAASEPEDPFGKKPAVAPKANPFEDGAKADGAAEAAEEDMAAGAAGADKAAEADKAAKADKDKKATPAKAADPFSK
ncbi:MAG: PQQ-binding-like beta-propeller repeat protein [Pirellulaceae bacterium]